jgi:hypothetical protein
VAKRKKKVKYQVKSKEKVAEIERKKETTVEEKFYWVRVGVGAIASFFGVVVFKIVGWWMLLYMGLFLLVWPFIQSFLIFRLPYQKDKWDWKQILKTGIGGYFFIFMFIGTICFTLMSYPAWDTQFSNPADTQDLEIEGDFAFIADGSNGFLITNITNPKDSKLIGSYKENSFNAQSVFIDENIAFIYEPTQGLVLLNLTDKAQPTKIANHSFSGNIYDIFVTNDVAFVALGSEGLMILDISNPSQPILIQSLKNGFYQDIEVINEIAYIIHNQDLLIMNVSDPSSLSDIGYLDLEGTNYALDVEGSYAYIDAGELELNIVNTSILENPELITTFNVSGQGEINANSTDLIYSNNIVYISNGIDGNAFVDVSDPFFPANMTSNFIYENPPTANSVALTEDYLFIAHGNRGLYITDLNSPTPPPTYISSANKTISMGWYWLLVSGVFGVVLIKNMKKKRSF